MKSPILVLLLSATACGHPTTDRRDRRSVDVLTTTKLPIIEIETGGVEIPDDPKIPASMRITEGDSVSFEGGIEIETRGSTSQSYPKKQWSLETQSKAALLDMPEDDDWILSAPYSDKTLMRDPFVYGLLRDMGRYAVNTRYVEVYLDGDYRGVYILMESIKRRKQRVDARAIVKLDKIKPDDKTFTTPSGAQLVYHDPKPKKLEDDTKQELQAAFDAFEKGLEDGTYAERFDTAAAVDHILANDLVLNCDGMAFSTYFHLRKDGTLVLGPVWDFNLAMGNAGHGRGRATDGWLVDFNPRPMWWSSLFKDDAFVTAYVERWKELRGGLLSDEALRARIDELAGEIGDTHVRNFRRWPILGVEVWPNPMPDPTSYSGQLDELRRWLVERAAWMDANIDLLRQ
jgi:spore coat protein CotH